MGLEAGVGELLAFPEAWIVKSLRRDFRYLSKALALAGHPGFEEPERLPRKAVYSSSIGPYSTLHRLRRVAAHLWKTGRLPRPRAGPATQDPVLRAAATWAARAAARASTTCSSTATATATTRRSTSRA